MPDLPQPRTNNAVARVGNTVVSALGLSEGKNWSDVVSDAWAMDLDTGQWSALPDAPGAGRLASVAVGFRDRLFLVGGYTVAEDRTEVSVPGIDVWSSGTGQWSSGPTMPIPVDDAVAAVWRNRSLVLVSGWSSDDNVRDVQLFDVDAGTWIAATPIIGAPVFGHAGAMIRDTLVYCGGVRVVPAVDGGKRSFVANPGCYAGTFESAETVVWRELPSHPGNARYRMAAGAAGDLIVFAGGTDNPYNYDGIGYDGRPSQPVRDVFAWHVVEQRWVELPPLPEPSMDHRGLVEVDGDLILIGGMDAQREPTTRVWRLVL